MAPAKPTTKELDTATRPRLQAINQDFSSLDEQIRQAAHIIGLPQTWQEIQEKSERAEIIKQLVRARAEWVLRWILDKLKDETDAGQAARANASTWVLLDWMVQVLPVSRSAVHLRDANLPAILERTLFENFGAGPAAQTSQNEDVDMRDASDSSNTMRGDSSPSRKRKRGANGTVASTTKKSRNDHLQNLFRRLRSVLQTLISLTSTTEQSDTTQAELVKMVLRTDSEQASRILSFWLKAVHDLVESLSPRTPNASSYIELLDLSLVCEIWDLRTIGASDNDGASVEEFSTECLIPSLQLLGLLQSDKGHFSLSLPQTASENASQTLDKLLARHLLAPSRLSFFAAVGSVDLASESQEVSTLVDLLTPLRAKLLQAAQIEDAGDDLPSEFGVLFDGVAHLLDLTIRVSPSRTPKGRIAEKPWIQAAFTTLAECAGCSLAAPPEFVVRAPAAAILRQMVQVLRAHRITLKTEMVRKLFEYFCGVKYPERQQKTIHWTLIAALIELDGSTFVAEQKPTSEVSHEQQGNLAEFIFEQISKTELFHNLIGDQNKQNVVQHQNMMLREIVIPLMKAFTQNRNLLGFLRRWDHQVARSYRHEYQESLKGRDLIWEDRVINRALADVFESVLTQSQIATLIEEHGQRLIELNKVIKTAVKEDVEVRKLEAFKQASSSAIIVPAVLQSIRSDDTLSSCKPHLVSLLRTYAQRVLDDDLSAHTMLDASWTTLCQLLNHLWPIELHASQALQKDLLDKVLVQAGEDIAMPPESKSDRHSTATTPAAATVYLSVACECQSTLPGYNDIIAASMMKIVKGVEASLSTSKSHGVLEVFCSRFVPLLSFLDANQCKEVLCSLLAAVAESCPNDADSIIGPLSQSIFEDGKPLLQSAYSEALLRNFEGNGDESYEIVTMALLHVNPSILQRATREKFLDRAIELLDQERGNAEQLLALMSHLMVVPNATAKISTNGKTIFDLVKKPTLQNIKTPATVRLFRELVHSTLAHILPNHAQPQALAFITQFSSKIDQIAKSPESCTSMKLSILRATIPFQESASLMKVKPYVELLKKLLSGNIEDITFLEDVLDAFNEISLPAMQKANLLESTKVWLKSWIDENSEIEAFLSSASPSPTEVAQYAARLQRTIARYSLYPNVQWLVKLTIRVSYEPLPDRVKDMTFDALGEALKPLEVYEKLDLITFLTGSETFPKRATVYRVLDVVITTLEDRLEANAEIKQNQIALLPRISAQLAECADTDSFTVLMDCLTNILNSKTSLTSQHSIESVLSVLVKLSSRSSPALSNTNASSIFARLCETTRLILLVHRGRLGGRFHLLLPLLQNLLFCLFIPNTSRSGALPSWLRGTASTTTDTTKHQSIKLTPTNATQYTRLLATLCNPPQSSITKAHQHRSSSKSKDLNDPVRAARERASTFLYPLLASYCRFTLSGHLDAGVREKLMPGIWEVVGTASLHKEGLDAMFAGLGRSERDVWRGIWGEWEGLFGRKGGIGVVE